MLGARMGPSPSPGTGSRGYSHYIMDVPSVATMWRGKRGLTRSMLLGGLLAAAVFLGLLTMHGHAGPGVIVQPVVTTHAGTTHTTTNVNAIQPAQTPASCADCLQGSAGLLMACMFALLVALGIVVPPRLRLARVRPNSWRTVLLSPMALALPRSPCLHMLCISRR